MEEGRRFKKKEKKKKNLQAGGNWGSNKGGVVLDGLWPLG